MKNGIEEENSIKQNESISFKIRNLVENIKSLVNKKLKDPFGIKTRKQKRFNEWEIEIRKLHANKVNRRFLVDKDTSPTFN